MFSSSLRAFLWRFLLGLVLVSVLTAGGLAGGPGTWTTS